MSGILNLLLGSAAGVIKDAYFNLVTLLLNTTATNGAQNNTFLDSANQAVFTASITTTVMTVSAITSGSISVGTGITGTGVTAGTTVSNQLTGTTGSTGTYTVSASQTVSSTTITATGFPITRNGNTTQGTFTPFSQTGWSNFFNSTANYLTVPYNANFLWSTGARTYEAFVYVTSVTSNNAIFGLTNLSSSNTWELYINTSSQVVFRYFASGAQTVTTTGTVPLNTWAHIAFVYDGTSSITIYINGVSAGTGSKVGTPVTDNNQLCIGRTDVGSAGNVTLSGYISNVRFTSAVVYTGAFTPSTTPLTAITNTSLLTSQSNRFVDNSASPATITSNGAPSVQAFSPFAPTDAYSTSLIGGSGYFDGSGDYLTTPSSANLGFGNVFTVEYWIYLTTAPTATQAMYAIDFRGGSTDNYAFGVIASSGNTILYGYVGSGNGEVRGTTPLPLNTWHYCAFVNNGTTMTGYLNGVSQGTLSTSFSQSTTSATIGSRFTGTTEYIAGYISGLRVLNGTAATISLPTTPPTAITNTALLTNFTNAGIYDAAAKNDLETVGNAQVSTTQAKFGTTSVYFDGSGDGLLGPVSNLFDFGSGDFTIEFWANIPSTSGNGYFVSVWETAGGSDANSSWLIRLNNNGTLITHLAQGTSTFNILTSAQLATNTWFHCAYTRNGNTQYLFINGVLSQSSSVSGAMNTVVRALRVGYQAGGNELTGYIDDLRITKGYARYTANFTPPAAAFPIQ
jgi:hypothetical protein